MDTDEDKRHPLHRSGVAHFRRGEIAQAIASIERALAQGADPAVCHRDLCEMCRVQGQLDQALGHGRCAAELGPDDGDAHYNLSLVHYDRGEIADAIACLRRVIALAPDHAGAHFELGEALLLDGDYRAGWEEYEWSFKMPGVPPPMPPTDTPYWQGDVLDDGTLLLVADQGFGDTIQFMRYVPRAAKRCRDLVIACSAEMTPLISQLSGNAKIFRLWRDAPGFDRHARLSSLPRLFKTEIDTIPVQVPYLRADPARAAHWKRRLGALAPAGYRRIGVVWAGRPEHGNDRNRSMTLKQLAPLAALDRVALVSLQKGPAGGQIGGYFGPAPLINFAPEIGDFLDTAGIIDALDLVVTVDTSVAHLAGAMAKPACVLLPFAPDWRWLRDRHDSPWYPSVRLFRQTRPGDWSDAVASLAQFIDKH
jgi:Tetratricopeptide repeat